MQALAADGEGNHFILTSTHLAKMNCHFEKIYEVVCEEYSEKPRAHTQFWTYIKNLSSYGILLTKISSKGLRGKTTLIGLTSPSPSLIEKQLKSSLKESSKKELKKV